MKPDTDKYEQMKKKVNQKNVKIKERKKNDIAMTKEMKIISFGIAMSFFFLSLIFTFFWFPFFFICSYLSVSGFILSLYLLILSTIFAPFCVFLFCFYFTQFIGEEKVNGSLSYTMWFV
jgi:hypothetical protein